MTTVPGWAPGHSDSTNVARPPLVPPPHMRNPVPLLLPGLDIRTELLGCSSLFLCSLVPILPLPIYLAYRDVVLLERNGDRSPIPSF